MTNPLIGLFQLVDAFVAMGIDYVVVGSIASSLHGDYRASADVDLIADIKPEQIGDLVATLSSEFYIDDLSVRKSVARGRAFNVIHLAGIFKIDVFPPNTELSRQQLSRRELHQIASDPPRELWIATAEDMILAKLRWFQLGQGISELQWRDVKGMIGTQGPRLDFDYLQLWAEHVGVRYLLNQALKEMDRS